MFTTTSLGQHQLSLFGISPTASATESGENQRSLFLQPITAAGDAIASDDDTPKTTTPLKYSDWLAQTTGYSKAADNGTPAIVAAEDTGPAATSGASDVTEAVSDTSGDGVAATVPDAPEISEPADEAGSGDSDVGSDSDAVSDSDPAAEASGEASAGNSPDTGAGNAAANGNGAGNTSGTGQGNGGLLGTLLGGLLR